MSAHDHSQYIDRDWFYIDIREYGITHHDMRIKNQTLAYGIDDIWPKNIDGVLGVGPVGLTKGTVTSAGPNKTIPTVMNNLASQKVIKKQVLGIYFAPLSRYEWLQKSKGGPDGALTYGGDDPKLVWMRSLFRLLSARCSDGSYVSCTVQGQAHVYSCDEDTSGRQLLGHQHHFGHVWNSHSHPHFHCWDY